MLQRAGEFSQLISDIRIYRLRKSLQQVRRIAQSSEDPEQIQAARTAIQEARRDLAEIRMSHIKEVRRLDLDSVVETYKKWEDQASVSEKARFKTLKESAEMSIAYDSPDFETLLSEIRSLTSGIMWKSDSVVQFYFYSLTDGSRTFTDQKRYEDLKLKGQAAIDKGRYNDLRMIVNDLFRLVTSTGATVSAEKMLEEVNVIRQ